MLKEQRELITEFVKRTGGTNCAARVLIVDRSTIKRYINGQRPIPPTKAAMMQMLLDCKSDDELRAMGDPKKQNKVVS
jgi:hypothetical protein